MLLHILGWFSKMKLTALTIARLFVSAAAEIGNLSYFFQKLLLCEDFIQENFNTAKTIVC